MKPDEKYMPSKVRQDDDTYNAIDNIIDFDNNHENNENDDINLVPFKTQLPYNVLPTGWIPVFIFDNVGGPNNIPTNLSTTMPSTPMGFQSPFGLQFITPNTPSISGSNFGTPPFNYTTSPMGAPTPSEQFTNPYYPLSNLNTPNTIKATTDNIGGMPNKPFTMGGTTGGMTGGTSTMGSSWMPSWMHHGNTGTTGGMTSGTGTMGGTIGGMIGGTGTMGSTTGGMTGGTGTMGSTTGGMTGGTGTMGSTTGSMTGGTGTMGSTTGGMTGGTGTMGSTAKTNQPPIPSFNNFNGNSSAPTNLSFENEPINAGSNSIVPPSEDLTDGLIPYNIQPTSYSSPRIDNDITEILRNFDLDLDEDLDLSRVNSDKRIDNIFLNISKKHPEVISLLKAYNIPFPIIKLVIRRIIKLSLIHGKRTDE
ncbi:hypothetical protein [Clostridium cibarium]|uniref:Uncharacterized protein n=1 Tax=Clostridium cibarium TaxID=2762247 RepID=A0ABR8PP04_9CLOT|nr:hypothetical protein [Clostridium cibarium]MBD7909913.1 hypothetical protein [Clostridium cibarium]